MTARLLRIDAVNISGGTGVGKETLKTEEKNKKKEGNSRMSKEHDLSCTNFL
jgi:hypothetical protein